MKDHNFMFNNFSTLMNITTPDQERRGNRAFECSSTGCVYISYKSGYIRRHMFNSKGKYTNYQLNRMNKFGKRVMINNESLRLIELQRFANIYAARQVNMI